MIVVLVITTWRGTVGAIHFYGRLEEYEAEYDTVEWRVRHKLTKEEAAVLNEKDGTVGKTFAHRAGEESERFDDEKTLIEAGKALAIEKYGKTVELYRGSRCYDLEDLERLI